MEKPIITLTPRDFLTGLGTGAHTPSSGLFYKAAGVTPTYDAGGSASTENGLLQAGPAPVDYSGSALVDQIVGGTSYSPTVGTHYLWMMGKTGHFYQKDIGSGSVTDLRAGTPIDTPYGGMTVWGPSGGTSLLYYWRTGKIGTWDMSGTYPTGWNDSAYTTGQSGFPNPVHQFVGNVYYAGGRDLNALLDTGTGSVTQSSQILKFLNGTTIYDISDDGRYLIIVSGYNVNGDSRQTKNIIYFWDTYSSSYNMSCEVNDVAIWGLQKIGNTVFAFGKNGLYEVSFGGIKKVRSENLGFDTSGNLINGYTKRTGIYNQGAFMFATDSTVDSYGKISPEFSVAYFKQFSVPSGVPSFIDTQFDTARVYVATDTPKLYGFDFNATTRSTGVSAQTQYIQLPGRMNIKRIDVVFGTPLASGDQLDVAVYKDEDTSAVSFSSASYATDGAIRRKQCLGAMTVEDQVSLKVTFTAGKPKIRTIEVYGELMNQ